MAVQKLPLPDSTLTLFFRALIDKIQRTETLHRVVKTWRVWDGSQNDAADPNVKELPLIRIGPSGDRATPAGVDITDTPLCITIEVYVNGTNSDDAMNLWDAVLRAIWPGDATTSALMSKYHLTYLRLLAPAYDVKADAAGNKMLYAIGQLRAGYLANTGL